ncbi:unnamed protein product [marine sediment metagenome]|uniref:Uncharacterized protein n=1 Tax=marine sediment metagenome TaxID=412755 RepID=X1IVV3_9ZZZZ
MEMDKTLDPRDALRRGRATGSESAAGKDTASQFVRGAAKKGG